MIPVNGKISVDYIKIIQTREIGIPIIHLFPLYLIWGFGGNGGSDVGFHQNNVTEVN